MYDVEGISDQLSQTEMAFVTIVTALSVIFGYVLCLYILGILSEKVRLIRPYLPIAAVGTVLPIFAFKSFILWRFFDFQFADDRAFFGAGIYALTGVLVFEAIYFEFVHPMIMTKYIDTEQTTVIANDQTHDGYGQKTIKVSNQPILIPDIVLMKSDDHYVELRYNNGESETFYGKLTELVKQTKEEWGVSPHRSYWVNRESIKSLRSLNGKKVLELTDGTTVPIARAKQKYTIEWIIEKRPDIKLKIRKGAASRF